MGIRPKKTIGWVVETTQDNVHMDTVGSIVHDTYSNEPSTEYSYRGFYDYIEPYRVGQYIHAHYEHNDSMDQYNITKFANIIVADDEYGESDAVYCVFYPMLLSPYGSLTDPGGTDEFKAGDTAFVHAEFEQFAPEAYRNMLPFSYSVKSPIYPSEYSVIERGRPRDLEHFTLLTDRSKKRDTYMALRKLQNNAPDEEKTRALYVKMAGFSTPEELAAVYELAPPAELFAFAHYLNVFKDTSVVYDMHPQVVYYWT